MTVIALDLEDVSRFLRKNTDTHGRGVGVTTLFLSFAALETLLVVLVLFGVGEGSLLSGR